MSDTKTSLLLEDDLTRRGFVVTSLAAGFAMATQPVSAQTITTDTKGLDAGEVKIPVHRRRDPRLSGDAGKRRAVPGRPGRAGDLRRPRAHQGHLPPPCQARLPGRRAGNVRPPGRRFQDQGDSRRSSRKSSPRSPMRRSCPTWTRPSPGPRQPARQTLPSSPSPGSAGAAGSSGCIRPTTPI